MRPTNVWIAFALISAAACGGGSSSAPPGQSGNTPPPPGAISVTNNAFSPSTKTVTAGTMVRWVWNSCSGGDMYGTGETCVTHDIVFDDGSTSGQKSQGIYDRAFATGGTFPYHCAVHTAAVMSGSITVTP